MSCWKKGQVQGKSNPQDCGTQQSSTLLRTKEKRSFGKLANSIGTDSDLVCSPTLCHPVAPL
eukprot:2309344-Amphidinium_carterae.1